jgi:DNA processing protein
LPEVARAAGVTDYAICPEGVIHAELKAARAVKARMLCLGDPDYPASLATLDDAPPVLWAVGDTSILTRPMVALVGARNASSLGTRMARKLAADLSAAGYVIVSGLARGVDAAAHHAAIEVGTVAVLGGGVDVIYPNENAELFHAIGAKGLRLSEQPIGLQPQARHFPARNRIISGLSRAVVVVEAAAKSGSLITAENALAQGREVFAVPGHPFDGRAGGCNALIRDGATLIRGAEDVIAGLTPLVDEAPEVPLAPNPQPQRSFKDSKELNKQILSRLGPSPIAEDQLIRDMKSAPNLIAPALIALELDGAIQRHVGGLLSRL